MQVHLWFRAVTKQASFVLPNGKLITHQYVFDWFELVKTINHFIIQLSYTVRIPIF